MIPAHPNPMMELRWAHFLANLPTALQFHVQTALAVPAKTLGPQIRFTKYPAVNSITNGHPHPSSQGSHQWRASGQVGQLTLRNSPRLSRKNATIGFTFLLFAFSAKINSFNFLRLKRRLD